MLVAPIPFLEYACAVGALVLCVTKASIFKEIRKALIDRMGDSPLGEKGRDLVTCPFCMSFWVSLALQVIRPLPGSYDALDYPIIVFSLMGAGSFFGSSIYMLYAAGSYFN